MTAVTRNRIEKSIAAFLSLFLLISAFTLPYCEENRAEAAKVKAEAKAKKKLSCRKSSGKIMG
jgi:hypothetical protein